MTHFRVKYSKNLVHVHARFFSSSREDTAYTLNGDLCFSISEWENFRKCLQCAGKNTVTVTHDRVQVTNYDIERET